ncbi:hypothetical protein BO83DRAFT_411905 [Aspergillus eucalypticola CBS 122712]|uniref:Uncharacterized protein n=1 Tax=Aspergillus eucalypticola (strain CBS 122712 / IBT 29274) TaxID=1448314 RepID=A0A317USP7_ASPEC|nr:uncharacterized protein BO83DRAFT_411905 [Aspergillus eucalypticola CBS 122712]PWY63482.1 hypothetical protein BO83DRAFT_411905 [Aspergillus eucalypticola CBS 122712]
MARLSLSIFVLCLFLALMVSAMPVKREDSNGNELDGTLAEQVAEQSLKSASEMLDQIAGKDDDDDKKKPTPSGTTDNKPSPTGTKHATESQTAPKTEDKVANTEPSSTTPTSTEETPSTSSSAPATASSHVVNDNPLSKIPLVGELLSGGGSGSLTGGLLG